MKNKKLWTTLVTIWVLFAIWEITVEIWAANEVGAVIRIDLILLIPILAIVSVIILFKIFRNKKADS